MKSPLEAGFFVDCLVLNVDGHDQNELVVVRGDA